MKKFLMTALVLFGFTGIANANGVNVGVSLTSGAFEVDGASEVFSGSHVSGASATTVTKKAQEDQAEGAFALTSIFAEFELGDKFAIGLDYVPHALETETTENLQIDTGATPSNSDDTSRNNKIQVDFEDLTTAYVMLNVTENLYLKAGYMQVDVITNENLATGGSYGNDTLDGTTVGFGYNGDMANDMFFRLEASYMEFDGAEQKNTADSNKKIVVDGITGFGARVSIGKSF